MRRWRGWGPRVLGFASMLAATGCQLIQGAPPKVIVRPSAHEELADQRVLEEPVAIAVQEDAIVRVVGPTMTCTGTVIEDDLILTAHHCLVGRGPHGEFSKHLVSETSVRVELGGDYFAWGEVGVRHIVAPPCGEGGGAGDLAVLVLKRKLVGLAQMTPRLDGPPKVGEQAYAVGFGRCALSGDAIKRKDRDGGPVRALSAETLHMEAAVCPGDSGGPVFARGTHEIIGVVSLSAMDHDEATRGPSVMARIDAHRAVFSHARMIADGTPPNELPPLSCNGDAPLKSRREAR
jgi:V8-like Glu-specific endopeptidase